MTSRSGIPGLAGYQRFILDDDDLRLLEKAAKPRLLLLEDQRTPQEVSNDAWQALAHKHEFVWNTVKPSTDTRDKGIIMAIPLDKDRVEPELPESARLCPTCNSMGFAKSILGDDRCEFCDGTIGGQDPIAND